MQSQALSALVEIFEESYEGENTTMKPLKGED